MEQGQRYFVKYNFYKVRPGWALLSDAQRAEQKEEFAALHEKLAESTALGSYSLVGIRGDADLMLRLVASTLEEVHGLGTAVAGTHLGAYLDSPYAYLAVTRRSQYVGAHSHRGQEGSLDPREEKLAKYLVVYPFIKSREWYALSNDERQTMMNQHIETGHRYPEVRINTSYSFGIDDQEFVVAFDTDDVMTFVDLVMDLRASRASAFTVKDTPAFTCIAMPIRQALDALDGATAEREGGVRLDGAARSARVR